MVEVVIDASLAVKWLIPESDSDAAEAFFTRHLGAMHAPDLLLIEAGGRVIRLVNERKATRSEGEVLLRYLKRRIELGVQLWRVTPDLSDAASALALALGHPLKDCIYLALADRLGCPLATCDVRFRDRVGDPTRVRLLAEMV